MSKTKTNCIMLSALMIMGTSAMAQNRKIDLEAVLELPSSTGTSIVNGGNFYYKLGLRNNGPDNLVVGDTIGYQIASANPVIGPLKVPLAMGEIFYIYDDSIGLTLANLKEVTVVDFCTTIFNPNTDISGGNGQLVKVSYDDDEVANNKTCATITIAPKEVAILNLSKKSTETLNLYPNPATTEVKFNVSLDKAEPVSVTVKDIAGRVVLNEDFGRVAAGQTTPMTLNLSALNAGMYFVELNAGERSAMGKVTISK